MRAHRLTHFALLTLLAAVIAALLGACGGSSKPSSPGSSGSSNKSLTATNPAKYPVCMRDHGVTNFPDPQVHGHHRSIQITPSIVASPAFKSAQEACAHLLPAGARQLNDGSQSQQTATEGLLAFSACMRKHGFPSFPDPTSLGELTPEMVRQAGINLRQPAVLDAGDACVSVSHGQVTKADVAQAVANPSAP